MNGDGQTGALGIIGGSGLYDIAGLTDTRWQRIDSPFGETSDEFLFGQLAQSNQNKLLEATDRFSYIWYSCWQTWERV